MVSRAARRLCSLVVARMVVAVVRRALRQVVPHPVLEISSEWLVSTRRSVRARLATYWLLVEQRLVVLVVDFRRLMLRTSAVRAG